MLGLKYFILGFLASLGFALKYELNDIKTLFTVSIGGGISWFTYRLFFYVLHSTEIMSYFFAAIFMSLYSEIMARAVKKPVTIFLIVAMLPLVPGQSIYDTMSLLVSNELELALNMGLKTLGISGALALGNLVVSTGIKFYFGIRSGSRRLIK